VRTAAQRNADARRLLDAARAVHADRAKLRNAIAEATGLSPEGVELGFASLERDATDAELMSLVASAGDTPSVHVILSANVFVAPLRAIAIARAAADRVTVRASPRDPVLARALVDAAADAAITLVDERDAAAIEAGEIHVYGRDETIAAVRARARPGVTVRGHGAGMGVAFVTRTADIAGAAEALAADVVPFDQRGCLSPRVAIVEGDESRADAFASEVYDRLAAWGSRVPRGVLAEDERAEATRWRDAMVFAGRTWLSPEHAVARARGDIAPPPPGRHVLVTPAATILHAAALLAPLARFVVAVGSDDPSVAARFAPAHARISLLGAMQLPRLDGPIDRRGPRA
jgi:hypothetical protein